MTTVRLSDIVVSRAIFEAKDRICAAFHAGGASIPDVRCSPVSAVVRRALHDDVTENAVQYLSTYNTRGGNHCVEGPVPETTGEYDRHIWRLLDDYRDGVQPLLILERVFNLAYRYRLATGVGDHIEFGVKQCRRFVDLYFHITHIDIGIYKPRHPTEVYP